MSFNFDTEYIQECLIRLRINAAISLPLNAIAFWVIYFRSPKSMGIYKYYLLNISIWSFILDLYTEVLYSPILLSPATAICSEGFLKNFAGFNLMHLPIFATLLGCCGASCLVAMIYRYCSITSDVKRLHCKKGIALMILLHFVGLPAGIGYGYIQMEDNDKLIVMEKIYPSIYQFYQKHTCTATSSRTISFKIVFIIASITFGGVGLVYGFVTHRAGRSLRRARTFMSHRTYTMQAKMYICLIYQSVLPLGCLAIPMIMAMSLGYMGYEDTRYINPWFFQIVTLHSSLNSIGVLVFIDAYRNVIFCRPNRISAASSDDAPPRT